jgi:ABC-2 type transport system ATP-binding protein
MRTNRVVGGQVTPIPVILDGRDRSVRRTLEMVSLRADAGARYKLQITPGTPVYATQRSVGTARVARVEASLPLVDASSPAGGPAAVSSRRQPRRLRIRVSSRRERGGVVRIVVRSKLRSRPCSGRVALRIRAGRRTRSLRTRVRRDCSVRAIVRLRVPRGTRARFAARFEGNSALQPRRAHGRVFRLR